MILNMGSKGWACVVGVTLPFALYAYIGILGRTQVLAFETPEYGPAVAERIYAYGPYLRAIDETKLGDPAKYEDRLLKVADRWVQAREQGKLTDIFPATMHDESDLGVRGEINRGRFMLIEALKRQASIHWKAGKSTRAVRATIAALHVAEVGKYADFPTATRTSLMQRQIMREAATHLHRLSDEERAYLARGIQDLPDGDGSMDRLIAHIELIHLRWSNSTKTDRTLRTVLVAARTESDDITARKLGDLAREKIYNDVLATLTTQASQMLKAASQWSEARREFLKALLTEGEDAVLPAADGQANFAKVSG